MSVTKREKILITVVLILAVLCVYYIYFLQPCFKELDELNAQKTSNELSVLTNQQIKSSIDDMAEKMQDNKSEIEKLSGNLSSKFDQPAVLVYLRDTVSEYAEKMMFRFEDIADIGQLKVCKVQVTMKATYDELKKVLQALYEGEYFVRPVELSAEWSILNELSSLGQTGPNPQDQSTGVPTELIGLENPDNSLDISLILEFYNFDEEIPPDKPYPFSSGYSYGGDIFF